MPPLWADMAEHLTSVARAAGCRHARWVRGRVQRTGLAIVSSCFTVLRLQAAALKPRINPGGDLRPQTDLYREQRVDFEVAQLPTLLTQLRERSAWSPNKLESQLLVRHEAANDSFNRSM